jgi:hypothetical protein
METRDVGHAIAELEGFLVPALKFSYQLRRATLYPAELRARVRFK